MAVRYVVNVHSESLHMEEAAQWVQHSGAFKCWSALKHCAGAKGWTCAADGVDAVAAAKEYNKRKLPAAPCGRYGATVVVYKQQMWLFGGTDGGFSKKGLDTTNSESGKVALP